MATRAERDRILILDYGSQFTQLIARRLREQHVYCEIHPPTLGLDAIRAWNPAGIVLSGGPSSTLDDDAPSASPWIRALYADGEGRIWRELDVRELVQHAAFLGVAA